MKISPLKNLGTYVFTLLLIAGLLSCKKDKDDPTPGGANGVEGSWKVTAITFTPAVNGVTDALAFYEAMSGNKCISQTVFIFKGNGTVDANVPAGCTLDDSPVVSDESTWKVNDNKIEFIEGGDVTPFDLEVNKNEMKWSTQETEDGVTYKMTFVFKRV